MLFQVPGLFEAWNIVTGGFSAVLAFVLLLAIAASAFGELWFLTNILNRIGSLRQNLVLLAIFSVKTPLLIALGFVGMFAPNVQSASDFVGFWALASLWIVPVSLLSEATIIYLLLRQQRGSVRIQV